MRTKVTNMDGDRLKKYLISSELSQSDMLTKYTLSKTKLYQLFKAGRISDRDKKILIRDFSLPDDFFIKKDDTTVFNEPKTEYYAKNTNEISLLRELLAQKDEVIKSKDEVIKTHVATIADLHKQLKTAQSLKGLRNN